MSAAEGWRTAGDVVRAAGVASFLSAVLTGHLVAAALFSLVLLGLTLLRLGVTARLDLATGAVLLAAAWFSLLDLYLRVPWLDVVVHLLATGLVAGSVHTALVRVGALPSAHDPGLRHSRLGATVVVVGIGLGLGVLWELGEWFGHTVVDDRIQVGYDDTVGDLASGGLGAAVAALALTRRRPSRDNRPRSGERAAAPHPPPPHPPRATPPPEPQPSEPPPSGALEDRPRVSVVIPVKDDAPALRRCLAHLSRQTVAPFEVVVVDNGSSDDSAAVAAAYGARVVPEPQRGIPAAAATGYDAAAGDIIARCDADSAPPPDWLARIVDRLAEPELEAVTGTGWFYDLPRPLAPVMRWLYLGTFFLTVHAALGHSALWGSNMALRRRTWLEVRHAVHRDDPELHDDIDLAFVLGPHRRIRYDRALRVGVSARCLHGREQLVRRLRRAFRTLRVNWAEQRPWERWAARLSVR